MKILAILFLMGAVNVAHAGGKAEAALQSSVKPLPAELQSSTKANAVREEIRQDVKQAIAEARANAAAQAPASSVIIIREAAPETYHHRYLPDSQPIPFVPDPPRDYTSSFWRD